MLPSPCINLCRMDEASALCAGCFRSIEEITAWARSDDDWRARILAQLPQRRQAHTAPGTTSAPTPRAT